MNAKPFHQKCLICGVDDFSLLWSKGPWRYVRCRRCKLVHLCPQPNHEQAIDLYDEYLSSDPRAIRQWSLMSRALVKHSADLIEKKFGRRSGRLLDIGCGYGFFLAEMANRGWTVQGVEISPAGRWHARNRLRLPVTSQTVASVQRPPDGFDVITLFYVIEHLVDPIGMLQSVNALLRPGGMVLLRWPHTTPIVKILGPLARKLDLYHTPYHIYDFSHSTLGALLESCGFSGVETTTGGYTLPKNLFARISSLAFAQISSGLEMLTRGRSLLPGVSKTTLAFKPQKNHTTTVA